MKGNRQEKQSRYSEEKREEPESPSGAEERLRKMLREQLGEENGYSEEEIQETVDRLIWQENPLLTLPQKEQIRKNLLYSVGKLDVLQELMDDTAVTEIMVNGYRNIFYERDGVIRLWDKSFPSRERYEDVIQQIAGACNRIVNEQKPIADARLENGARVNVVLPPVALDGAVLTIRRFPDDPITMRRLVETGSITGEAAEFLGDLVQARYSILIGGGTSTGKTTFLNALSGCIPEGERVITIEDNAELQLRGISNLVRLEARDASMEECREISIRDLIRTALRMRPDRIIVGEVRGAEAADFLVCLNTGHEGSLGTAHANSAADMIERLVSMVMMSGMELPVSVIRRQIAAGVEILVHLSRDSTGKRKVEEIAEITGMENGEVCLRKIFSRDGRSRLVRRNGLFREEKLRRLQERRSSGKNGLQKI